MADPTLSTRLSRRSMLAGGTAALTVPAIPALPAAAVRACGDSDARIATLAARHRRATTALVAWVTEAEHRHGPFAYETRPEYCARYEALATLDRLATEALARSRPASLRGLVLKLRPAFYCETLYDAEPDCDADILLSALHDLERLAAYAGSTGPMGR